MNAEQKIERNESFAARVKGAVIWRSGSQIVGQVITWASTFLVIRMLSPTDYGLVAMPQVVLVFFNLMNGWGFGSALVQAESVDRRRISQVFGMLLLLNGALAAAQFVLAPFAAAYFRQPMLTELLRFQALFYFATPFTALGTALLSRTMEFRRQAQVNLTAAMLSALTAIGCAYAGMGVWTLVAAPGVYWWARAIGFTLAARLLVWPSFRFGGAGKLFGFGSAIIVVQLFWFVQSQADVFIGGRMLDAHQLGIYTTALFLTQILSAKFVPPLNEIAFAAYSRIQDQSDVVQSAFLKSVRLIMLVALPFYFGLAVTAEPLVLTFLGPKWVETAALVPILAMAMPFMTLQILFSPATNALGRPGIAVRTGLAGAILMPAAFLVGIGWGMEGLAWAWLGGMAVLCVATALLSLPTIGIKVGAFAASIGPGLFAAAAMGALVFLFDSQLDGLSPPARLALLVTFGAAAYAGLLLAFARATVEEAIQLIRPKAKAAAAQAL